MKTVIQPNVGHARNTDSTNVTNVTKAIIYKQMESQPFALKTLVSVITEQPVLYVRKITTNGVIRVTLKTPTLKSTNASKTCVFVTMGNSMEGGKLVSSTNHKTVWIVILVSDSKITHVNGIFVNVNMEHIQTHGIFWIVYYILDLH